MLNTLLFELKFKDCKQKQLLILLLHVASMAEKIKFGHRLKCLDGTDFRLRETSPFLPNGGVLSSMGLD